ncbi:MAG TPA: LysR family transcriptional regulator [Bordetella sp.]|jgi:DNA-binding transcriptional LysR family regulator|nr:LysR family transcriptional regulator [Bordetella sp.]
MPKKKSLQRRHIEALVAVGDNRSVHRAAQELGVPQPVLSRLLGEAETLIGARLFDRSSHGSVPTPQGRLILPRARFALRTMERLNDLTAGDTPPIRLGCIPRAMHTLLPHLLERVYPDAGHAPSGEAGADGAAGAAGDDGNAMRFEVREGNSIALFNALAAGELDFAILRGNVRDTSAEWVIERLFDERTVVYCATDHPGIPEGQVSLSRLAALDWTLPERGTTSRGAFDAFWSEHGLPPIKPLMETRSFEANLALVAASRLVSIAPESIVRRHVGFGVLRIVKVRRALPVNPVMLAFHRMSAEDPTLSRFRRYLLEAARIR